MKQHLRLDGIDDGSGESTCTRRVRKLCRPRPGGGIGLVSRAPIIVQCFSHSYVAVSIYDINISCFENNVRQKSLNETMNFLYLRWGLPSCVLSALSKMPNRAVIQAKRLLDVRSGLGSLTLPADIKALHISFAQNNANGHMGPRKFVQQNIPRIQFHNPHLEISVTRVKDPNDPKNLKTPAFLQIVKNGEAADSAEKISVQGLRSEAIVDKLKEMTSAVEVSGVEGSAVIA